MLAACTPFFGVFVCVRASEALVNVGAALAKSKLRDNAAGLKNVKGATHCLNHDLVNQACRSTVLVQRLPGIFQASDV